MLDKKKAVQVARVPRENSNAKNLHGESKQTAQQDSLAESRNRILNAKSPFSVTEAYKTARTNLLFLRTEESCQTIAVTSTFESEGKTTNCVNLSITLAQAGLRTLLVDADFRRPMLDRIFGMRSVEGLSDYLACLTKEKTPEEALNLIKPTEFERLSLFPAGHIPPNPAELLSSKRMEQLFTVLSARYDYIMIDTPPASVVTDATVLKNLINGYLIVVRAGQTPQDGLTECIMRMKQIDASILGILLNDVDAKSSYQKYSYKYRKYGHYYKYGDYAEEHSDNNQQ